MTKPVTIQDLDRWEKGLPSWPEDTPVRRLIETVRENDRHIFKPIVFGGDTCSTCNENFRSDRHRKVAH